MKKKSGADRQSAANPNTLPERKVSAAEAAARARGFKGSQELREAFGIDENFKREIVHVDTLPDPVPTAPDSGASARTKIAPSQSVDNLDETVLNIFREEAEEIRIRLQRFGIPFGPNLQQDLVDHAYSLIAMNGQGLMVGGGAIGRR